MRVTAPWVTLAIPSAFLLCAVVMRLMIASAPASMAVGIGAPIPVATNWHGLGAMLLGALFVSAAVAAAAYAVIISARCETLSSWPAVVGVVLATLMAAWCAPVLFSSDVYAYAAYGELARLGGDPYLHRPLALGNPVFDAAIGQWGNPPPACVYGLSFVWLARAIVSLLHPAGVITTLHGLRWLSSSALLLTAPLAYCAFNADPSRRVQAAATIALNPVAIWCAAEGHNDALTIAVMLAGFALIARGRTGAGAALAALAGSIKLPGIAGGAAGLQNRRAVTGAAVGVAAAIALSLPLLRTIHSGMPRAQYAPQASFQAILHPLLYAWPGGQYAEALTWMLAGVAAAACVTAGIARLRRRDAEGWAYLALGGWMLVPNPYPWYGIWLLPIAAAAPGTRGALALIGLSFTALLRYVPDAVAVPDPLFGALLGVAACLPFLALLPVRASGIMRSRS